MDEQEITKHWKKKTTKKQKHKAKEKPESLYSYSNLWHVWSLLITN